MVKAAAVFAMLVGVSMAVTWVVFFAAEGVPELETRPLQLGLHLVAEGATAIMLILAGWGLWGQRPWAEKGFFLAGGMLLYTVIMSPGYFLEQGHVVEVAPFGLLLFATVFFLWHFWRNPLPRA